MSDFELIESILRELDALRALIDSLRTSSLISDSNLPKRFAISPYVNPEIRN